MKKPEPWPVTGPRPPRGPPRRPGGKPSGPPKRRKKRSIGDPGGNGESSSLLALSSLELLSAILILTEITDGFTRSTMSAKPIGRSTLRTSLLTCACAALVKTSTGPCGLKPYTAAPRPATTEAISANLRAENSERRAAPKDGSEERSMGRSVMFGNLQSQNRRCGGLRT